MKVHDENNNSINDACWKLLLSIAEIAELVNHLLNVEKAKKFQLDEELKMDSEQLMFCEYNYDWVWQNKFL
jgi:hypothetical protein